MGGMIENQGFIPTFYAYSVFHPPRRRSPPFYVHHPYFSIPFSSNTVAIFPEPRLAMNKNYDIVKKKRIEKNKGWEETQIQLFSSKKSWVKQSIT